MRRHFQDGLRCPHCGGRYRLDVYDGDERVVHEGNLECSCGRVAPIIAGIPRIMPTGTAHTLGGKNEAFFGRYPKLLPTAENAARTASVRTVEAFGDEWQRFPELLAVHRRIFAWYFEGPMAIQWRALRVLDAGCGMGRWLHFAREAGGEIVGMDVSPAVDVAAAREGEAADFVQADLRWPPFAPESFDLVYSLGVLHHLEEPLAGVRALAKLVRPGGELRFYVYRTLDDEPWWKRALFAAVTGLRRVTTRLPYSAVHGAAWFVAATAVGLFIWPRELLRERPWGDRLTRRLPLVQYADVPFRMVVSEQFDRLVAPIEGRYRREDVEGWLRDVGFEIVEVLPGLGWRAIGRRPAARS